MDLGTDLKVRYKHRLVAEFRRDAVDGWWYKSFVLNDSAPFGGEGAAADVARHRPRDERLAQPSTMRSRERGVARSQAGQR